MDDKTRQSIQFGSDLKSALKKAEQRLGVGFDGLKALIDKLGGVKAARQLLSSKQHFKSGFCYLRDNDMLDYTVEAFVVKYADAGIFDPDEIDKAQWRLDHALEAEVGDESQA